MSNSITLEKHARFSQSLLWQYQRDYFASQGINAWIGNVPYYVTSNSVIAYGYAQVAFRFIQEGLRKGFIQKSKPLYLLELGTGSGRFSFQFLKYFSQMMENFGVDKEVPYCYVMTDFTDSNLSYWRWHPRLKPFIEKGCLDFAIYNLDNPTDIILENTKKTLNQNSCENPIVLIGNYIFDTVTHDAFRVENNELKEGLIEIKTDQSNVNNGTVKVLEELKTSFEFRPCTTDYYDDPALNKVLSEYKESLNQSTFLIPTGAIACINHIRTLSNNKLFLITGDKGYTTSAAIENLATPHIAFHGSFSMMVNFHALSRYIHHIGGDAQLSCDTEGMKMSIFSIGTQLHDMPDTLWAYDHFITHFSTKEFLPVKNKIIEYAKTCNLLDLMAVLKLSYWDPDIFFAFVGVWTEKVSEASKPYLLELREGLKQVYDNYYFIRNHKNILFELGHMYQAMGDLDKAIELYLEAQTFFGEDVSTWMNIGLCYYYKGNNADALTYFEKALALEPNNENVKEWINFIK